MLLYGLYIFSCLSLCVLGCHRGEGEGTHAGAAAGSRARPGVRPAKTTVPTTTYSPPTAPTFVKHHRPKADVWLGEMEFVNLFCGTGTTMPSIFDGIQTSIRGFGTSLSDIFFRRRRRQADNGDAPTNIHDLSPEELNKYKLDHSLLYFRGQAYEWGAGMFLPSFVNGTVNRNPAECGTGIQWTLVGRSSCTFEQMWHMAHSYIDMFGDYALLTNNCHHFVERMIQKLNDGNCRPFFVNP